MQTYSVLAIAIATGIPAFTILRGASLKLAKEIIRTKTLVGYKLNILTEKGFSIPKSWNGNQIGNHDDQKQQIPPVEQFDKSEYLAGKQRFARKIEHRKVTA